MFLGPKGEGRSLGDAYAQEGVFHCPVLSTGTTGFLGMSKLLLVAIVNVSPRGWVLGGV